MPSSTTVPLVVDLGDGMRSPSPSIQEVDNEVILALTGRHQRRREEKVPPIEDIDTFFSRIEK